MIRPPGVSAPLPPLDVEAFLKLQQLAEHEPAARKLNAIDRALDRLIAQPKRQTCGERLAYRVLRDAQKHLKRSRDLLCADVLIEDRVDDEPQPIEREEIRVSVLTILQGLEAIKPEDRRVLQDSATDVLLSSNDRRKKASNIALRAAVQLRRQVGVRDAFSVLFAGLARWHHQTAELLQPLVDYLAQQH